MPRKLSDTNLPRKPYWQQPGDLKTRFWSKVDIRGEDECWPWKAGRKSEGYGFIKIRQKHYGAHRVAYELTHDPLPDLPGYHGPVVRHLCGNRICVNPKHLEVGTQRDNMWDEFVLGGTGIGRPIFGPELPVVQPLQGPISLDLKLTKPEDNSPS